MVFGVLGWDFAFFEFVSCLRFEKLFLVWGLFSCLRFEKLFLVWSLFLACALKNCFFGVFGSGFAFAFRGWVMVGAQILDLFELAFGGVRLFLLGRF